MSGLDKKLEPGAQVELTIRAKGGGVPINFSVHHIDLLTIKCTTLKRDQFLNHFLFFIEIAQQVYVFTPKHKLWPCFIKNDHDLYFLCKK